MTNAVLIVVVCATLASCCAALPNPDPGLPPLLDVRIPTDNNNTMGFNPILALLQPEATSELTHGNHRELNTPLTEKLDETADAPLFAVDQVLSSGKISVASKTNAQNSTVPQSPEFKTAAVQGIDDIGGTFLVITDAASGHPDPPNFDEIPEQPGQVGPEQNGLDPNRGTLEQLKLDEFIEDLVPL